MQRLRADTTPRLAAAMEIPTGSMRSLAKREAIAAYLFISPAAIFYLVFIVAPLFGAIGLSLFEWDLLTPAKYVGFQNYRDLMHDEEARTALANSFKFAFWSIVLHIGFGLLLALAINRIVSPWLKYFLRTAYFFPLLMSWASVSLIWLYILDPNFGFLGYYLDKIGVSDPPRFLLDREWAMPTLIAVDLWRTLGFTIVILLAGLQAVPQHLHEAAMIDGAGAMSRFWNVTIPMLSPTLFFVLVMNFIGAFQIFEPMFIMTKGGPKDSTVSIVMHIYETGFRSFAMGSASAMAIVVFLVIMVVTLIQLVVGRYWVYQE